ncbi:MULTISPECIES: tryptophan--tRNA ligase [Rhodanobacter]|uniref:tryptophan--tRNA ligase n=1 Tax=Rhodanobacter TaxID=75309 RepID=UPI000260E1F5|nr:MULTISPECIES: tryptophan--tRNA ligase [Rhodanobacter]EIM00664.1 tryptophanyl-tRNA ligase [Rhodanobacter denitrificans]KZC19343.1 tryptophan--tRNA ligase [Rhodanobacter denitrificans]UJJ51596.1 tryptophan--tRNA ligase [Rhodanobacter denitrificans]UJJ59625.1 tryptophan--tRNA ligase [Rhodanobacter denitrificans]UJM90085.1 tryptophan--tRNA ligase [Rhodanobacter denitrificans]
MNTRVLTGITTTGTPHLGNYVGAIRPAVEASRRDDVDAFFFLADYHALIKSDDAARIERSRLEIAASWLAAGLDPQRVTFYRQSDIPEIPELTWFLTCIASKGMLNRAHAYKAAVDKNAAAGEDADAGITAGLYMYPVLMAADILAFDANQVPVGRDQIQHIEMARDLGQRFNHLHGHEFFVLPEALIEEQVATLPGLDGRKMSKSYDNTIPLFAGGKKQLREAIMRIVTDSRAPGEPKDPDDSALFTIFRAFASEAETAAFRQALLDGSGWGEAKLALYERIEADVAPMRERYEALMADPAAIETILQQGAQKARAIATPKLAALREVLGLRAMTTAPVRAGQAAAAAKPDKAPRFASFRDADGSFRFRLFSADGEELLLSKPFADPKAAGALQKRLGALGAVAAVLQLRAQGMSLELDGETVASTPDYRDEQARDEALAQLRAALDQLAAQA